MKVRDYFIVDPAKNSNKWTDFINYIDTSSVINGSLLEVQNLTDDFPSRANKRLEKDDILYSSVRPLLKHFYHYTDEIEHAIASTGFCIIRNKDKKQFDTKFLFYYLSTNQIVTYLDNIAQNSQATFPTFSKKDLEKIDLPSISLPTQQKIASILSAYDNLIQNYKKQIEALQTGTCELYKEWFVRFRFPGWQNATFENGIPEGWKVVLASELGEFIRGKNITAEEMQEGMIPVISAGIEPSGFHNQSNVKGVSLTISNSGANAGYLQINYSDIWAADCSYCNSAKHIYFYYELLNNMRVVLFNLQKGAAQPHVYAKDINKMKILLPPSELIEIANKKIKLMHEKIYSLQQQITNLTQQRDLLLPRLMSGKLEI